MIIYCRYYCNSLWKLNWKQNNILSNKMSLFWMMALEFKGALLQQFVILALMFPCNPILSVTLMNYELASPIFSLIQLHYCTSDSVLSIID